MGNNMGYKEIIKMPKTIQELQLLLEKARKEGYDEGYDNGYNDGLSEHEE